MLINIKISKLYPHPNNPRRDVGDVTELADSIKKQGLFQNLTVVSGGAGVPNGENGYTVIIGHRRLAAAKLAGLTELPCSIAEMDERQQAATMLLENMQRSDLTAYEQAQGFQMMLDLGETKFTISEKTGFSAATVNNRLKLLSFDRDGLKSAEERGGTMSDYIKAAEIKDEKVRNAVLETVGTNNFEWKLNNAINDQICAEKEPLIRAELEEFATEIDGADRYSSKYESTVYASMRHWKPGDCKPSDYSPKGKYCFCIDGNGYTVLKEKKKQKAAPIKKSRKEIEAESLREQLKAATQRAYELRCRFVENFRPTKADTSILLDWLVRITSYAEKNYNMTDNAALKAFVGDETAGYYFDLDLFNEYAEKNPLRAALIFAYCKSETGRNGTPAGYVNYAYGENPPIYQGSKTTDICYAYLCKLGYALSDEEQQLKDGTHPLFGSAEK